MILTAVLLLLSALTVYLGWYGAMVIVHCWFGVLWGNESTLCYRLLARLFPAQAAGMSSEENGIPATSAQRIAMIMRRSSPYGLIFCALSVALIGLPVLFVLWWAALAILA